MEQEYGNTEAPEGPLKASRLGVSVFLSPITAHRDSGSGRTSAPVKH